MRGAWVALLLLFLSLSFGLYARETEVVSGGEEEGKNGSKLKVAVVLFENSADDESLGQICTTSSDILESTLRLLGKYRIRRADFLLPTVDFDRASLYLEENDFDNAIYGSLGYSEEVGYTFSVYVWDREEDAVIIERQRSAQSVFDIFDIVDDITAEVAEAFTGEHIGYGTLKVVNTGAEGNYSVYVDEQFLGRNITERKVLYGSRKVRITAPTVIGEKEIYAEELELEEGEVTEVSFSLEKQRDEVLSRFSGSVKGRGTVAVETFPSGIEVILEGNEAGSTPLELYGIPSGRYAMRLAAPGYIAMEKVIEVMPDQRNLYDFRLRLDVESERLQKELRNPMYPPIWAGVLGVVEMAMGFTVPAVLPYETDGMGGSYYFMLAVPRIGHFTAGATTTGMILNSVSLATALFPFMLSDPKEDWLIPAVISVGLGGTLLYDIVFASRAADKQNEKRIERIKRDGFDDYSEWKEAQKEVRPRTLWAFEMLGGSLASLGVSYPFWERRVRADLLGGLSFIEEGTSRYAVTATFKGLFYPFRGNPFDMYAGPVGQVAYNAGSADEETEAATGYSAGLSVGIEYSDFPWLPVVPYIEGQMVYGIDYQAMFPKVAIGVRF